LSKLMPPSRCLKIGASPSTRSNRWSPRRNSTENLLAGSYQYFPRDPMVVIGSTFIEVPMFLPIRRKERFAIRQTIGDRLAKNNAPLPQTESPMGDYGPGRSWKAAMSSTSAWTSTSATPATPATPPASAGIQHIEPHFVAS
jgi:hypothetical protein